VFAAGGRYDRLIEEHAPNVLSNRPQAHAVGFNLGSDRLRSSMIDYLKAKAPSKDSETGSEMYWAARRVSISCSHRAMSDMLTIPKKV
jgi:translation initiation factor 2-alpha kinase 4